MNQIHPEPWTIRARWIVPVGSRPIADGTITIQGERIVAVEAARKRPPDHDLGNVVVLPGLVNAHTHLDLGGLRGSIPEPDHYTHWLREVVQYRCRSSVDDWNRAVRDGIEESIRNGTTLLADVSASGCSGHWLENAPIRSVVFFEVIGLHKSRAQQSWRAARAWLDGEATGDLSRRGLSPHAPYTVRHSLFRLVAATAERDRIPITIHFAEFPDEARLLAEHTGPLRSFLEELEAFDGDALMPDWASILQQFRHHTPVVLAHGNYLCNGSADAPDSIFFDTLLPLMSGTSVVYCPRTHAYFGHPPHPLRKLMSAGIDVAIGTDSLASNPDLSMLAEMRYLWRRYRGTIAAKEVIRMGTLAGAKALGWDQDTGSLEPGKSADWIAIPLPATAVDDPLIPLLEEDAPVCEVCCRGRRLLVAGKRMQ